MPRKKKLTEADKEDLYAQMRLDLESGECAVIQSNGSRTEVYLCGKFLGAIGEDQLFRDQAAAMAGLASAMRAQKFWPSIYSINDHGNVTLLDNKGNEIMGWV